MFLSHSNKLLVIGCYMSCIVTRFFNNLLFNHAKFVFICAYVLLKYFAFRILQNQFRIFRYCVILCILTGKEQPNDVFSKVETWYLR